MAKLGFDYEVDFENTDKQGGGGLIPHSYCRIWAEAIELKPTNDTKGYQAEITFEVQEPEDLKGKKFWAYWTIVHADGFNHGQYKYGKPQFDRLGRAVDVNITGDTDTDELLFKSFVAEIEVQEGGPKADGSGNYKDKNQIARFFFEDAAAKEPVPQLGLIGDGTAKRPPFKGGAARTPANDNRPAASRPAPAAAAGGAKKNPWSK
ncbi:MAG: hypothetical protein BGN83_00300 [Rhizobium sp. 63-7]|nr:MAG: hypothetical protein BGN83_00300 [Rhizobium sp. 63-7]